MKTTTLNTLFRLSTRRQNWILFAVLLALLGCERSQGVDATQAANPLSQSDQVDKLFAGFTEGVQPGAAVMVIQEGEIVHSRGYGYASLAEETPITSESTFRLGSVSKQFTAMAIAILADRGQLEYDDLVSQYVPALSSYEGITVRHLLTHTSGLPDYYDSFDPSPWVEKGTIPANSDVMLYEGQMGALLFEPGERYVYSNPAYEALPLVVEAVSGMTFAAFMQKEVFQVAGMSGSLIHDQTQPFITRRVLGYSQAWNGYELNDDDPLNGITGSGSQYSTLSDFYQWDQALYDNTLVSEETILQVFTRAKLNNGQEIDYGFGWRLDEHRGHRRIAHGGGWVGFNTAISRYPDMNLTVVILSNRAEYDPVATSDEVADIYIQ